MTIKQIIEPGDGLLLVVKGTVPFSTNSNDYAEVTINPERPRPTVSNESWHDWHGFGDALDVYAIANAKVEVIYTSKFKNGVHIDLADGSYWMRRPDGWHAMATEGDLNYPSVGKAAPKQPQRLRESR